MAKAIKKLPIDKNVSPPLELIEGQFDGLRASFLENDINDLKIILSSFSTSDFIAQEWDILIPSSGEQMTLCFPELSDYDGRILRAAVLEYLACGKSPSCKRIISDSKIIFSYLSSINVPLESILNPIVRSFIEHLDTNVKSVASKKRIMSTLGTLLRICQRYDLIKGSPRIDLSFRWEGTKENKRAPEMSTVNSLDILMFNRKTDIPLSYRTIYVILRLKPSRISEILSMPLECLMYRNHDDCLFELIVATSKETPYHVKKDEVWPYDSLGFWESILLHCVEDMQKEARALQDKLPDKYKGFLFVDSQSLRTITATDFNNYLKNLCAENHIYNSDGNIADITSHDFRHLGVVERLFSGLYSFQDVQRYCSHHNIETTAGYGYPSKKDEAARVVAASKAVFEQLTEQPCDDSQQVDPTPVRKRKFETLKALPYTKHLPDGCICISTDCLPGYEKCASCKHYRPDQSQRNLIVATMDKVKRKMAQLEIDQDTDAMAFHKKRLSALEKMLKRMDSPQETEEE